MSQGLTHPNISGGTINSDTIIGGSIVVTAGTVSTGTINVATVAAGTINNLASGTINLATVQMTSGTLNVATISILPNLPQGSINVTAGTITEGTLRNLISGTINAATAILNNGTINLATVQMTSGTLNVATISTLPNLPQGSINVTAGTMIQTVGTVNTGTVNVATVTAGTINVATITGGTLQNLNFGTIAISDGTTKANIMASGVSNGSAAQNAQMVAGGFAEFSGSQTAGTADIVASFDVSNYKWASLQITGTWVGTVNYGISNDNSNFQNGVYTSTTQTNNGLGQNINANNIYFFPLNARYLRIRTGAWTSGTVSAVLEVYNSSPLLNFTSTNVSNGSITNIGIVNNAGTLQAGTINSGTIQINPKPTTNIIPFGTVSSATIGTLIAAPGVGTSIYVTSYAVDMDSGVLGTPDLCLSFGTTQTGGSIIFRGGDTTPFGLSYTNAVGGGITNQPLTWLQLANSGTVAITVTYFTQ